MLKDMTPAEVRAARRRLKLSQIDFGKLVGRSLRTIAYWEATKGAPGWVRAVIEHYERSGPKRPRKTKKSKKSK